ncbi:MAG: hypothetical protein II667_05885 [Clostridiales bacterium]|nr:hypothetical protein [Clostridiales bacterium]MBQ4190797.1 hypothetical protein [Clostridiales bacterium]MBQ4217618.1 hypothetical protein [Clostridiales bacterium]
MSRVNVYTNAGGGVESVNADARQAGKVTEVKRDVNDIRSEILSLKIMVQAMMEIMNERGIETEAVNARIEEIMTRPETFVPTTRLSKPCPKCGRIIMDNGNTPLMGSCLYCGEEVKFVPLFETGSEE